MMLRRTFRYDAERRIVREDGALPDPEYEKFAADCEALDRALRTNDGPNVYSALVYAHDISFGPSGREMHWP